MPKTCSHSELHFTPDSLIAGIYEKETINKKLSRYWKTQWEHEHTAITNRYFNCDWGDLATERRALASSDVMYDVDSEERLHRSLEGGILISFRLFQTFSLVIRKHFVFDKNEIAPLFPNAIKPGDFFFFFSPPLFLLSFWVKGGYFGYHQKALIS